VLASAVYLGIWVGGLSVYYHFLEVDPQRQMVLAYLLGAGDGGFPHMEWLTLAEKRHLLDVRRLFATIEQSCYWVLAGSVVLLIGQRRATGQVLRASGYLGITSVLLLLLLLMSGFLPLFVLLHTLLFPVGTWVFPADSSLIQLFPLDYFFRFALWYVGSLTLFFGGWVIILKGSMGFSKR